MSVQSSSNQIELHFSNPEKSLQFRRVEESESDKLFHDSIQGKDKNAEDVPMADHLRPMEELLRIPILGIEDAIVVPAVLADQFELKPELLDFVRAAEKWLENEPPCSITTWDALLSKFLNRFFPYSKIREFRKEITNFQQVFGETFIEAWERFKDLLRKCPHHGFSLLHQIDFFYNGLCQSDQDSLNTAAGGNLMTRNIQDALTTIENKASVRTCRNTPQVSSSGGTSTQIDAITILTKQVEALDTDGLTLDGSFLSNSNFLETEQEPETITEVVEIASSKSTPLVPPPKTPPLSAPKPKEDPKPNPYQPPIPYPFSSPSLTPSGEIDLLLEETDSFLSLDDSIPPGIDNGIYDSEGDILFLEELLKDEPSKADKLEIYTLKGELPDTFLMEDDEIKLNPLKDSDDSVPIPRVSVTPLDSLDSFFDSYDTSYTNPSELDYEYTLNYDNLIFNI
ncbi:reverse transcriptase domain-containing protein [Tanacetum coccineum]